MNVLNVLNERKFQNSNIPIFEYSTTASPSWDWTLARNRDRRPPNGTDVVDVVSRRRSSTNCIRQ